MERNTQTRISSNGPASSPHHPSSLPSTYETSNEWQVAPFPSSSPAKAAKEIRGPLVAQSDDAAEETRFPRGGRVETAHRSTHIAGGRYLNRPAGLRPADRGRRLPIRPVHGRRRKRSCTAHPHLHMQRQRSSAMRGSGRARDRDPSNTCHSACASQGAAPGLQGTPSVFIPTAFTLARCPLRRVSTVCT